MAGNLADRIAIRLAAGPGSAADLVVALGVSQPTLSRALRALEAEGRVVRFGTTRGARYGLLRTVAGIGGRWPLHRIDEHGTPRPLGTLDAVAPDHYRGPSGGALRLAALTDGLPYYLQDARPAGFLGRSLPAAFPELSLPSRVVDWTDDHTLVYLARRGSDVPGDLILGEESLDRYLANEHGPPPVSADERAQTYPRLARLAMGGAPPGSSAHGEHPKFSARLVEPGGLTPVLVKFSPERHTPVGERWADLLVAEGVASELLAAHGIASAATEIHEHGGRVFLESRRFDRIGADGRRGVASLLSVDALLYGRLDRWARAAKRLSDDALLSPEDARHLALLDAFGELIGNTDRHFGNISLFDDRQGPFRLAPVYDMLPMLFAPLEGQIVERRFEPEGARSETLAVWPEARELALAYWTRLTTEARLTAPFRRQAGECLARVENERLRAAPRSERSAQPP